MLSNNTDKENFKKLLWDSQRCQRNWDLTKTIPNDDLDLMVHSIKSAPSKQNESHFCVYGIFDYNLRKKIYNGTENFAHDADGVSLCLNDDGSINYKYQSQLIGNFLFVFCRESNKEHRSGESFSTEEFIKKDANLARAGTVDFSTVEKREYVQKRYDDFGLHAIGIAVGYLLITAHMLGYRTGCSAGFSADIVSEITGHPRPEIIVAVGFNDKTRDRREEHFQKGRLFPSWNKEIKFEIIK